MTPRPSRDDRARLRIARPIWSVAQHRRVDEASQDHGVSLVQLMDNAGRAVANAVTKRWAARETVVLCGPGNNGGDGYVAARVLAGAGWPVRVVCTGPPRSEPAKAAAAQWSGSVETLTAQTSAGALHAGLVIDALYGAGLSAPLQGEALALAQGLRQRHHAGAELPACVAIDVPSGVPGDGLALGTQVLDTMPADVTVTFTALKPAHVLEPTRDLCGSIVCTQIGHPTAAETAALEEERASVLHNAPGLWPTVVNGLARGLDPATHKHARGALGVLCGPGHATGAARLVAHAGLRMGAGLVTLACTRDAVAVCAAHETAVMIAPLTKTDGAEKGQAEGGFDAFAQDKDALVLGPAAGITAATSVRVLQALRTTAGVVLDADALTIFAADPPGLFYALRQRPANRTVLTPHLGEFRRLFPQIYAEADNKIDAVRRAARACGAVVLLKGQGTVIAGPGMPCVVNTHASPYLATAGSGDVLAGIIGGLMAQGVGAFDAACAGAWLHGDAGLRLGVGQIAEDLPDTLPKVLRAVGARAARDAAIRRAARARRDQA